MSCLEHEGPHRAILNDCLTLLNGRRRRHRDAVGFKQDFGGIRRNGKGTRQSVRSIYRSYEYSPILTSRALITGLDRTFDHAAVKQHEHNAWPLDASNHVQADMLFPVRAAEQWQQSGNEIEVSALS